MAPILTHHPPPCPGTPADQTISSLVTFSGEKLTPQSLATNASVSIELLPWWLSFERVQKNKDLLVVENMTLALGVAFLAGVATVLLELSAGTKKQG